MPEQAFQWGSFLTFAFVNSATPGPNIVMLTSSGSAWGFLKSLPLLIGICLGFPLMLLVVQFGAEEVFARLPWLFPVLTVLSLGYVIWLAVRIFKLGFNGEIHLTTRDRPMSFLEAALFQWVNGKAWQIVLMVATLYPTHNAEIKMMTALTFIGVLIIAGSFWIEAGKRIARYLQNTLIRKAYYAFLALSLLLSTVPTGIAQLLSLIANGK